MDIVSLEFAAALSWYLRDHTRQGFGVAVRKARLTPGSVLVGCSATAFGQDARTLVRWLAVIVHQKRPWPVGYVIASQRANHTVDDKTIPQLLLHVTSHSPEQRSRARRPLRFQRAGRWALTNAKLQSPIRSQQRQHAHVEHRR